MPRITWLYSTATMRNLTLRNCPVPPHGGALPYRNRTPRHGTPLYRDETVHCSTVTKQGQTTHHHDDTRQYSTIPIRCQAVPNQTVPQQHTAFPYDAILHFTNTKQCYTTRYHDNAMLHKTDLYHNMAVQNCTGTWLYSTIPIRCQAVLNQTVPQHYRTQQYIAKTSRYTAGPRLGPTQPSFTDTTVHHFTILYDRCYIDIGNRGNRECPGYLYIIISRS